MLAALAALVPAPALAKELRAVAVCGASGCSSITDREALHRYTAGAGLESDASLAPAPPSPYYLVRTTAGDGNGRSFTWRVWYVPAAGKMRGIGERGDDALWFTVGSGAESVLREAVQDVEPFPVPRVTEALVGGRRVDDPGSYLALFAAEPDGFEVPAEFDWAPVVLRSEHPSPWTDDLARLEFSPSAGVLLRGGTLVKLLADLAARVRHGESLAAADAGFPWLMLALALAGAALAAAVALGIVRRSRAPLPRPSRA